MCFSRLFWVDFSIRKPQWPTSPIKTPAISPITFVFGTNSHHTCTVWKLLYWDKANETKINAVAIDGAWCGGWVGLVERKAFIVFNCCCVFFTFRSSTRLLVHFVSLFRSFWFFFRSFARSIVSFFIRFELSNFLWQSSHFPYSV